MQNIKVSVLVTFYNQEKYVDRAIKSILDQERDFNLEVLVGDDGSTDRTQDIIKSWINQYPEIIKLFVVDRNNGSTLGAFRASENRINLLKQASGKYFNFLDGDDFFTDSTKLQQQVDILENPSNQDCVACAHDIEYLYFDGARKTFYGNSLAEGKYTLPEYWKKYYFHTDTLLARTEVRNNINFNLLEYNFNDNLITFAILQSGSVYYLPFAMAGYEQTGDGIWTGQGNYYNNMRSMFVYDFANIINPQLAKQSLFRFAKTWSELYNLRNTSHDDKKCKSLEEEAKRQNLNCSLKWFNYNNLAFFDKLFLSINTIRAKYYLFLFSILSPFLKSFLR